MAMSYWYNNKLDSAKWAFKEGVKCGGFGGFTLAFNRKALDACSQNSILISSGDMLIFPLLYLQIVENYRPDVSVVDISLLNTNWYPSFLSQNNSISFDIDQEALETIEYTKWNDTIITISNFSWTVKPSYYDYLLRGDRVFLILLKGNKFKRDVFFTNGFNEKDRLSLKGYLKSLVFIDKLVISEESELSFKEYKKTISEALMLFKLLNQYSSDELGIFSNYRWDIFRRLSYYLSVGDIEKGKKLLRILDKYTPENKYPYQNEQEKKNLDFLREKFSQE